jgi:hypothetical protein
MPPLHDVGETKAHDTTENQIRLIKASSPGPAVALP